MQEFSYLNFDLSIEKSGENYAARVTDSPVGQASASFPAPFTQQDLEIFVLRAGRSRGARRRLDSPEMQTAKKYGERLFEAVFNDEVYACLRSSLDQAQAQGKGLRVRLRINATELSDLPWEYLYNSRLNNFLSLSVETPVVRYLPFSRQIQVLKVAPPLRLLVTISSPSDFPELDVDLEWTRLQEALAPLVQSGALEIERVSPPTLDNLQHKLRRKDAHIFHFVGHGGFDAQAHDGVLIFENENRRGRAVNGETLGTLLHDERTLRLVVLNACEGGRTSPEDPYAGVAYSLVQQGIPAVIAMQFEISDEAAITLAYEFYAAIADGYQVDTALAEARKAVFASGNEIEWGTPVLFTSTTDGRIFNVAKADGVAQSSQLPASAVLPPASSLQPPAQPLPSRAEALPVAASRAAPVGTPPPASVGEAALPTQPGRIKSWWVYLGILGLFIIVAAAFFLFREDGDGQGGSASLISTPTESSAPTEVVATLALVVGNIPADTPTEITPTEIRPTEITPTEINPTEAASPDPTLTSTIPPQVACPSNYDSRLQKEKDAWVCIDKKHLIVLNEPNGEPLFGIDDETKVYVANGPKCTGGSYWWEIWVPAGTLVLDYKDWWHQSLGEARSGWAREGPDPSDNEQYSLCPSPPKK